MQQPNVRPSRPHFSSGPCAKRPGWNVAALEGALTGRSHRSKIGLSRIQEVLDRHRRLLQIPDDYRIALVPASDTGAVEMALWSLLGSRGVDMLAWDSFGVGWVTDVVSQLRLSDVRRLEAPYGELPDLRAVDFSRDVVFTWNGTTSGVCVPNGNWIAGNREGLTICDATSAVFAMDLPWGVLDVATWSWQKVLGGEAAHGMLVLSPRAVERLETFIPPRPLPKIFRMTKGGQLNEALFRGSTINTPSMLCVEDVLDALRWVESIGGAPAARQRAQSNLEVLAQWVAKTPWVDFLAKDPATRSCTSICLSIVDPWFQALQRDAQLAFSRGITSCLEAEGVAYDIHSYADAPPGLRIWGGATVESSDLDALTGWLDWAYHMKRSAVD